MLVIIDHIGRVCFHFCRVIGIILLVLGVAIQFFGDGTAVWIFYYFFGVLFLPTGYLIKYILCHNS